MYAILEYRGFPWLWKQTHTPHTVSTSLPPISFECCWKQSDSQKQNLHSRLWARENLNRQVTHSWKWHFILEAVGPPSPIKWTAQLMIRKVFAKAYRGFAFLKKIMNLLWVTFCEANNSCDREAFILCMYILQALKSY